MVDAVIILANLMDGTGKLNEESARRAQKGVEVFRKCSAKALVTCGWPYRNDSSICIADAFRDHLIEQHNILHNNIITEVNSRDTVGDAYFTKVNIVIPRGWKDVTVVTSDYHVNRTREIFEFIYGSEICVEVEGAAVDSPVDILENEAKSLNAFRKTFNEVKRGDSGAILERLREKHPFYNGEIYNRI